MYHLTCVVARADVPSVALLVCARVPASNERRVVLKLVLCVPTGSAAFLPTIKMLSQARYVLLMCTLCVDPSRLTVACGAASFGIRLFAAYLLLAACIAGVPFVERTPGLVLVAAGVGICQSAVLAPLSQLFKLLPAQVGASAAPSASLVAVSRALLCSVLWPFCVRGKLGRHWCCRLVLLDRHALGQRTARSGVHHIFRRQRLEPAGRRMRLATCVQPTWVSAAAATWLMLLALAAFVTVRMLTVACRRHYVNAGHVGVAMDQTGLLARCSHRAAASLLMPVACSGSFRSVGSGVSVFTFTCGSQVALLLLLGPTMAVAALIGYFPSNVSFLSILPHHIVADNSLTHSLQLDMSTGPDFHVILVFVLMISVVIGRQVQAWVPRTTAVGRRPFAVPCSTHGLTSSLVSGLQPLLVWSAARALLGAALLAYVAQPLIDASPSARSFVSDVAALAGMVRFVRCIPAALLTACCARVQGVFGFSGGVLFPNVFRVGRSRVHAEAHEQLETVHSITAIMAVLLGLVVAGAVAVAVDGRVALHVPG